MSLETTANRASYAGNGATTVFSFPYYFLANADLVVKLITVATGVVVDQVITTNYTVTGAGLAAGGSITMLVAPASGKQLLIYRDPSITQPLDLRENDSAPAEAQEEAFDRAAMIAQRTRELAERSVRLNDGFTGTFDVQLPVGISTPGVTVITNPAGNGFIVGPTADTITSATAATAASAAAAAASASAASTSASAASTSASAASTSASAAAASAVAAAASATDNITKSTLSAAGSLVTATGAATPADLPIGTDNQVLTVDTSLPKKMKWSAGSIGQGSQGFGTTITSTGKTLAAADDGKVFKLDSTAGAITINAHAAAAGFKCTFIDAGGLLSTNVATLVRNGSQKIINVSGNYVMESNYGVWSWYFDGTDWWMGE